MGVVENIIRRTERDALPYSIPSARAVAGRGLEGDYHFAAAAAKSGEALTLIAAEAIEAFVTESGIQIGHEDTRRQVLTRGVDLNALVGRRFRVGDVECEGVELCEPCNRLVKLIGKREILRGLVHRGGLRADILSDGQIAAGDAVQAL
jgi:MOSC domain-containing protein YiiM